MRQLRQTIREVRQGSSLPNLYQFNACKQCTINGIFHGIRCNNDGVVRFGIGGLNCSLEKDLDRQFNDTLSLVVFRILVDFEKFDFVLAY